MYREKIERPDIVDYEHLEYLDSLKDKGVSDSFIPYLEKKFRVTKQDAKTIIYYWIRSYDERHPS